MSEKVHKNIKLALSNLKRFDKDRQDDFMEVLQEYFKEPDDDCLDTLVEILANEPFEYVTLIEREVK